MRIPPTASIPVPAGRFTRLCSAGVILLGALLVRNAYAADYLNALEAEAADVKPASQDAPAEPAAKPAKPAATGENAYLSVLEAEADDLESQQTKKEPEENTGIRFSRIRY